jgi:hypothetical protein
MIAVGVVWFGRCMRWSVVRWPNGLADDVCFAYPRSLGVWEDDGNGMTMGLELSY